MTEPTGTEASFGVDGTQLPDPLPVFPDALTGPSPGVESDVDVIEPIRLPPSPDAGAIQEAVAAALADEPPATQLTAARPAGYRQPDRRARGPQQPGARPPGAIPPMQPPTRRRPAPPSAAVSHRLPMPGPPRGYDVAPPARYDRRRPTPAMPVQHDRPGDSRAGCVIALIVVGMIAFALLAEFVGAVADVFG